MAATGRDHVGGALVRSEHVYDQRRGLLAEQIGRSLTLIPIAFELYRTGRTKHGCSVIRRRAGEPEHGVLWKFDVLGAERVRVFEGGAGVGSQLIADTLIQMDDLDLLSTYDSLEAMLDDGWNVAP